MRTAAPLAVCLLLADACPHTFAQVAPQDGGGTLSTPQWLTLYDTDLDPVRGQQNFSNLVLSDLRTIDDASRSLLASRKWYLGAVLSRDWRSASRIVRAISVVDFSAAVCASHVPRRSAGDVVTASRTARIATCPFSCA